RTYFDAYDFKKIGEIADKVILMAHDYDPTSLSQSDMASGFSGSPGAPAEEVYYALQQITDTSTGIADRSKIMLQISFAWTEWLTRDGKTVKSTPGSYSMENFLKLFSANVTSIKYSELYKCPYLEFSDTDGIKHTVWYEDSRSIEAKYKMAQLFNIHSISIWRLGNIPEFSAPSGSDTYQQVWTKIKHLSGRL
ncbi:MAG: hypothetical protein HGA22_06040, partial [Clostridiales bacterium]|nr:hypothetical protein [Clostridiales bacterium]